LQRERIEKVIRDRAIQMVYQPVTDGATGTLVGVEALARFSAEPLQGPDRWFSDAEQVGLGIDLELCAVDAALHALPDLPHGTFLAINVSPATVLTAQLARRLTPDVAPRVVVELTEHQPVENYEMINAATDRLRRHGARIAADDAGAGYAGFRHLLGLRPDIVKLDICLVRGIDEDPGRRALARALVQFTDDTGAKLIAEGIETAEELSTLADLGVAWMQGYFLGRPAPLSTALVGRVAGRQTCNAG
jgi:EAL domain-containing protein (putative c-di-GMP-specific phosphodiesterase class I)